MPERPDYKYLLDEIIHACGGYARVLKELERDDYGWTTFNAWKYQGIPHKHWPLLIELSDGNVTADMLHNHEVQIKKAAKQSSEATE